MGQVESVMIRDVAWVDQNEPLRTAVQVMSKARISCLVVCDDSKPIGILTERDLPGLALRLLEGGDESRTRIGQLMSTPVITVRTESTRAGRNCGLIVGEPALRGECDDGPVVA